MAMTWTTERKLAALLRLPWTILREKDPESGDIILRVKELPGLIAVGESREEAATRYWDALTAMLSAYLHFNDPIPLPAGWRALPWERVPTPAAGMFRLDLNPQAMTEPPPPPGDEFAALVASLRPQETATGLAGQVGRMSGLTAVGG